MLEHDLNGAAVEAVVVVTTGVGVVVVVASVVVVVEDLAVEVLTTPKRLDLSGTRFLRRFLTFCLISSARSCLVAVRSDDSWDEDSCASSSSGSSAATSSSFVPQRMLNFRSCVTGRK